MGKTNGQVDNVEQSLELMLQCKYVNQEEEVGMRKGEKHNGRTNNIVQSMIYKNDSEKARQTGLSKQSV